MRAMVGMLLLALFLRACMGGDKDSQALGGGILEER